MPSKGRSDRRPILWTDTDFEGCCTTDRPRSGEGSGLFCSFFCFMA
jgi:hypothetical protein